MLGLLEQIRHWADAAAERPAHSSGGLQVTYAELWRQADAVAAYLADALPDDCSPVAVRGHKEPEMLAAFLGAVTARHPYVPLDISIPEARVERIIETAQAKIVLTPERVRALANAPAVPPPERVLGATDPFYIIFTSGSTGEPKGVVITLGCLTSFVEWMLGEQHFAPGEVFLNQAPFSFDLSVMDLYCSLATGGTLFSLTGSEINSPRKLYPALGASNVVNWVSTPSFARICLTEKSFDAAMLPHARRFLFCGETLPPDVAGQLLERFPQAEVWNTYGPTEATVATTSVKITREMTTAGVPLSVGYPRPASRILIRDGEGKWLNEDERGEIIIAGPHVSPGYLNKPDLTRAAFFELDGLRAYRTGDAGHFHDGQLYFEGRLDFQIKLHGYRIELGDVETNLAALPGVRDAVVVTTPVNQTPEALAAFLILQDPSVIGNDGAMFDLELSLRQELAARVPSYMIPARFVMLEAFPMTPNGKADRRKLASTL